MTLIEKFIFNIRTEKTVFYIRLSLVISSLTSGVYRYTTMKRDDD